MKYIVFEDNKTKWLHAVIFADALTHSEITVEGCKAVSAGFFNARQCQSFGESVSLTLKSKPEDYLLLVATLTDNSAALNLINCNRTLNRCIKDECSPFGHCNCEGCIEERRQL